ncbi:hypothetical protein evm_005641 [Chilo suppressalis]|nr:hypothetical protein evm_005641 [Chilo suppressalis]
MMCTALVSQKKARYVFRYQRFRSGNFELQNQPHGLPETIVENEELNSIAEADPSQSTSEIAAGFGQLQTMKEELAAKQPRLVNRSRPLLLHATQDHTLHNKQPLS